MATATSEEGSTGGRDEGRVLAGRVDCRRVLHVKDRRRRESGASANASLVPALHSRAGEVRRITQHGSEHVRGREIGCREGSRDQITGQQDVQTYIA